MFENVFRPQKRFKSYNHDGYTEEVNKIVLSSNDDKRMQTFDRITTYPYGTNACKVCEIEMLSGKRSILWKIIIKWCYTNKYKNGQLW